MDKNIDIRNELIQNIKELSPEELKLIDAFVAGLKAGRVANENSKEVSDEKK